MCQFAGTPAGSRARGKRRLPERGTKKMGYLKYLKLMNRMNAVTQVPQPPVPQFEKFCRLFVTDEEYDIMMGMKLRGNTEAELRALYTGSDWAGTLYDMCRKGFLLKIYDGPEPTFDLAPMLPGWFEFPLSTGEDNETLQKASELFTSAINMVTTLNVEPLRTGYAVMNNLNKLKGDKGHMEVALPLEGKAAGKVVHVDRKLSNDTTSVVPSYQLEAYLDSLPDDSPISVMHCFCRNIRRREGLQPKNPTPDEVCLCVGNIAKQIIEYGVGRQVSKAEARQILVDCEKKGCVHQVFHYACNMDEETTAICNCDTQCCEMLGSYTRGGMQPLYMRARKARHRPPGKLQRLQHLQPLLPDRGHRLQCADRQGVCGVSALHRLRRVRHEVPEGRAQDGRRRPRALLQAAQEVARARAQRPPPAEEELNARGGHCQGGL